MQQTLANVDVTLVEGEAYQQWMEHLDVMQETLRTIAAEATLETQRAALAPLSQALYRSLRQFAATGLAIYYQHCPMADSNQGAYWLSESKEIRNPYFGDKMLTCGSLKETIN